LALLRGVGRETLKLSELTERVSPAGGDAHHVVGDVVSRQTDRLDAARVRDVVGQPEQRDVVVGDAAIVSLVRDDLHYVDDPLRTFVRQTVVFAQHHAEVRRLVRPLSAVITASSRM